MSDTLWGRALTDALGNLVDFNLLPGQRCDTVGHAPLIQGGTFAGLIAELAFDTDAIIAELNERSAELVISQHPRRQPLGTDLDVDKWRHLMENLFRKLKDFKRTALRSAKTDTSFTAMIYATAEPSPHDESRQAQDNGFIERRWLPLKYECGHLHAWESGSSAKTGIGQRMTFSNHHRPASNRRENDPPDRFLIRLLPGGTPAAGFCRRPIAETRPDQPVQETARISPETVQTMGSSAVRTGFDFQRPPRLHGVMHHPAATTFTPLVKIRLTGSGHRLKE